MSEACCMRWFIAIRKEVRLNMNINILILIFVNIIYISFSFSTCENFVTKSSAIDAVWIGLTDSDV